MKDHSKQVKADFVKRFHHEPTLIEAPGRINLIGEHVDYNQGIVLPAAIDRKLTLAMSATQYETCNLYSKDFDEGVSFSIYDLNSGETWVNYLQGVLDGFARRDRRITGLNCSFGGDIPIGAGISLSAAMCCGFAFGINEIFKFGLNRLELAYIAQHAEREFGGVQCGLMDQYASLFGVKDSFLLLDCRKLEHEVIPTQFQNHSILLLNTMVKHSLASSAYNERKNTCDDAINIIKNSHPEIFTLRDVTVPMLEKLKGHFDPFMYRKSKFVVNEIARVKESASLLKENKIPEVGKLMYQSHWELSKDYEVSCEELDYLVTLAQENQDVVLGSRMMGGGFGGCTINILLRGNEKSFLQKAKQLYFEKFNLELEAYQVNLSEGIKIIKP